LSKWFLPFICVGLPMGTTKPRIEDLTPIMDRIERRAHLNYIKWDFWGDLLRTDSHLLGKPTV
jgi:hypothetical protein